MFAGSTCLQMLSAVLSSLAGNGSVEYHYVTYYFRSVDFNSSAILTKLFRIYLGTINLKGQVSDSVRVYAVIISKYATKIVGT